jgi:hypothetical protein
MAYNCEVEMAKQMADWGKARSVDKIAAYTKSNMLATINGRLLDFIGGTVFAVPEMALSQRAASLVDKMVAAPLMARHLARRGLHNPAGQRFTTADVRVRMFNGGDMRAGMRQGIPAGFKDSWTNIRTGTSAVDVNRTADTMYGEVVYETPFIGKPLTFMVNGVLRTVQSMDRPMFWSRFHFSLREQARLKGVQQGLSGDALEAYIDRATRFATTPEGYLEPARVPPAGSAEMEMVNQSMGDGLRYLTHEDAAIALHDGKVAVFQDESTLANMLAGLKRGGGSRVGFIADNPAGKLAAEILFPFVKTASNAGQRTAEYTPGLGLVMGVGNLIRAFRFATNGDLTQAAHMQRYAVDQLGRQAPGVGALLAGMWLYERGMLSLSYPADRGEQGRWELENKTENSIRIGGHWYPVERLPPFGPLMVIGGYLSAAKEGHTGALGVARGALGTVAGLSQTIADQPAMQGAEMLAGIFGKEPEERLGAASDWLGNTAGSMLIPNIVNRWAQWTDTTQRERYLEEISGQPVPEVLRGALGTFAARIPYVSDALPARHGVLGDEVKRNEGGWEGFWHAFIDPLNSRLDRSQQDAVTRELNRLGVGTGRITRKGGEDREIFYQRRERWGIMVRGALAELIHSPEYQSIAEARRWAAENVPGIDRKGVERQIEAEQRQYLEDMISAARSFFSAERRAGNFTDDVGVPEGTMDWQGNDLGTRDNLPTQEEMDWTAEEAYFRALDKANDRISDIEGGMPLEVEQ